VLKFLWRWTWRLVALALGAALAYQLWLLAQVWYWIDHNPATTAFMDARLEALQAKDPHARLQHYWVPYDRIATHLKRAVVAAEDARFIDHEGFDWEGIQHALERNYKRGKVVAGGSTISQQLAKNLFLSGERSWLRKAEEAAITWMMEHTLSKRRILELYLNVAEWGDGVFGAEAAARYHFGVPASQLAPEQAAWLAAILPSPRTYKRGGITAYSLTRAQVIFERMPGANIP